MESSICKGGWVRIKSAQATYQWTHGSLLTSSQEYQSSMNLIFVNLLNIINSSFRNINHRPKILNSPNDFVVLRTMKMRKVSSAAPSTNTVKRRIRRLVPPRPEQHWLLVLFVPSDWLGDRLRLLESDFKTRFWALPCIAIRPFRLSWRPISLLLKFLWELYLHFFDRFPAVGRMDSWWL